MSGEDSISRRHLIHVEDAQDEDLPQPEEVPRHESRPAELDNNWRIIQLTLRMLRLFLATAQC